MASIRPIDKNQIHLSQIFALSEFSNDLSISKVEAILNNGFNVNYVLPVDDSVNYEKTKPDLLGCSALHFVVKNPWLNRVKILDLLLTKGADFTHKNHDGLTPLCLLFYRFVINNFMYEYSACEAMINRLLLAHYESNNTNNPHCKNGISHFHIACIAKNVKMAKFYLEAGVPVNLAIHKTSKIIPGFTPLHIAIRNKDIDMIRLLLEHGTDYTCLNANGMSILHLLSDEHCHDDFFTKINERYDNEALKNSHILGFLLQLSTNDFNPLDQIGFTKLHMYCIRHDNAETLEDLQGYLKRDDNINATVSKDSPLWPGYSPLHFATHCRKKMILLLKNGADFLAKDANGISPLDFCIKNKCKLISISCILKNYSALNPVQSRNTILIDFLRALKTTDSLSEYLNKVNVNTAIPCNSLLWPGYTLLHLAVVLSDDFHRKKVNLCLKEGVDITVKDANGLTALELAFQMKKTGHVSAILEAYADDSHEIDKQNIKLFHIACAYRNEVVVKKFLSAGLDPDTPLPDDFKILLKSYHDGNQKGPLNLGHTPLLNAVYDFWSKDLAKLLLEFKADPHIVDADGFTWIHRSFFGFNSYHDSRNLLLPHIKAKKSNLIAPGGLSYLHIACYAGTTSIIKSLLTSKNVNEPITSELLKYIKHPLGFISVGDTPLHFAVKGGNEKNVMFLLSNGANAGAKNADSLTPLHVALTSTRCRLKTNLVIKRLYEKSCRKCNVDEVGFTPLHVACAQQDAAWIDKLLRDGGDIDSQINSDSPIWPSYTPVDIISNKYFYEKNVNAINVLLSHIVTKVENSTFSVQVLHAITKMPYLTQSQPKRRKITSSKDSKDTFDTKLLLFAFHNKCMGRQYDVVEKLIKLGVDVNAPKNCFTVCDAGYTPLHFAVKYGSKNVIEVLVQHGADVTLEDPQGYTPLHLAAEKFPDKLEILLRYQGHQLF
ncbi:ankyrin-3-like [Copidosoma floridanum]|uniref:ankyrin-3-like n=1 Tax=Copidosoma floridanum TaxID=29053 RepID=UPI0006C93E03|nr:ankyrin-3-like [Copidosoma floridanum]